MKRYLFLGDTHGDFTFATDAMDLARQLDAEIIQLGDWGFYWPSSYPKIAQLSSALVARGVTMRFIDGNHDEHPRLRAHVVACEATQIAPNLIYQPRGSIHEDEDGTRLLFLGGAPSIDRRFRVAGRSWWPEEVISDEDFERAMAAEGPVHVVVTHDAPAFPPGFGPLGSLAYRQDQDRSMYRIDALLKRHRPILHAHGHWHCHYQRELHGAYVVGLDCNSASLENATFAWSREERT